MHAAIAFLLAHVGGSLTIHFDCDLLLLPIPIAERNAFDTVTGSQNTGIIIMQTYGNIPVHVVKQLLVL